jgi:branched-chain amino acid transport system permease protein
VEHRDVDAINDGIQYLISSLSLGGLYALMALGLVIVYGILRLVNFAYGELVMIGGYGLLLFGDSPLPWIIVALLSVIVAVIAGVLMERIAFRPVRDSSPTTMLITSFALSTLLQSVALLTVSPRPRAPRLPSIFVESFTIGGLQIKIVDLIGIIIGVLALVALTVFLRRTVIGLALRAAADDFTMTRLLGVPANRVIAAAFAISGLMAGIVALFWIGRTGQTYPTVGLQPVLIAFIASVVGGMESLRGAVLGGYVLGFLTMGLQTWLPQGVNNYRDAVMFGIVIVVLLLRPQGLIRPAYSREVR